MMFIFLDKSNAIDYYKMASTILFSSTRPFVSLFTTNAQARSQRKYVVLIIFIIKTAYFRI